MSALEKIDWPQRVGSGRRWASAPGHDRWLGV